MNLRDSVSAATRALLIPFILAACGRFGFESTERNGGVDAAVNSADSAGPVTFATGTEVDELNADGFETDDANASADLLEIYFISTRPGGLGQDDVYRSQRSSIDANWDPPTNVPALNTAAGESTLALSSNALWLLFGSRRDDPAQDVYLASRPNRSVEFESPVRLAAVNGTTNDSASWVSDDGLTILLHSDRGGSFDVYRATRSSTLEDFEPPQRVVGLDGGEDEINASVNGASILFASRVADGDFDLFVADLSTDFKATDRVSLDGPNTSENESDPWLSPDGCTLFFSRAIGELDQLHVASCQPQ